MVERVSLSGQQLTLDEVRSFRHDAHVSIERFFSGSLDEAFACGESNGVAAALTDALEELDHLCSLSAMSSVEATLRVNYLLRVYRRNRDPLSRAMRLLYRDKAHRVRLETDLIALWRDAAHINTALVQEIVRAFHYRHWLAHGRYWTLKLGKGHHFPTILEIANEFVSVIEQYDAALE